MLSRVADSLYWMSRYLERAEHTSRLLLVHLNLTVEQPPERNLGRWGRVLTALNIDASPETGQDTRLVIDKLCFNPGHRSSIVSSIMAARANARQVREQISSEMWEQLNRLYHEVRSERHEDGTDTEPVEFLNAVLEGAHLFQGLTGSTMSHGEGWQFIQLGRFLERTLSVASMIHVHHRQHGAIPLEEDGEPSPADYPEWIGLLKAATAFEAYCKIHTPIIHPREVMDFLVLSDIFPHSLRFSAEQMHTALNSISEVSPSRRGSRVVRLAGRLKAMLSFSQIDELIGSGVDATMEDLRRQCAQIHDGAYQAFISYSVEAALEA